MTYMSKCTAYRPNHSTETALLRVRNDLLYTRWAQGCHTSATRYIGSIRYDRSHNHVHPPQRPVWNNCNMSCMVWVAFGKPKSTYSNARQNISGTSSGVRCSTMFRSRPSHVYLLHCSTRWYSTLLLTFWSLHGLAALFITDQAELCSGIHLPWKHYIK